MYYVAGAIGPEGSYSVVRKDIKELLQDIDNMDDSIVLTSYTRRPICVPETMSVGSLFTKLNLFLEKNGRVFTQEDVAKISEDAVKTINTKQLFALPDASIDECKSVADLLDLIEEYL